MQLYEECDTAIKKKAVYIEVKLQYWIQSCKSKLLSIDFTSDC